MINKKTHGAQTEGKTKSLAGVTVAVMTIPTLTMKHRQWALLLS